MHSTSKPATRTPCRSALLATSLAGAAHGARAAEPSTEPARCLQVLLPAEDPTYSRCLSQHTAMETFCSLLSFSSLSGKLHTNHTNRKLQVCHSEQTA